MRSYNEKYTMVRFLNAVPGGGPVDIYLNDNLFFKNVIFPKFTSYIYVPNNSYTVRIFPSNTTDIPLLIDKINIAYKKPFTISIAGTLDSLELIQIEDLSYNNSKLRIIHLSPNTPMVDVLFNKDPLFYNIEFGKITNYTEVIPSTYNVEVVLSQNERVLKSNRVSINENRIYTLYILGNSPNIQLFQSLDGATSIGSVNTN